MKKILEDIISSIKVDAPVTEINRGIYWTSVVSRHCGLASTMLYDCESEDAMPREEWRLQMSAIRLARGALSDNRVNASLGLAAINSLIDANMDKCLGVNASDYLARQGKDKNIAIIGHFPFVDDLRKVAGNVWVIEKRMQRGDHPEDEMAALLERSDIVAISSTTLINHTLENILALCPAKSIRMLLGPTTPLTEVLFENGIDVISGSIVTNQDVALLHIRQGANFRRLKSTGSVKLVTCIKDNGGNALHV